MVRGPADESEEIRLQNVNIGEPGTSGGWKKKLGEWVIAHPWEKLQTKYTTGTSLAFDHFVFNPPFAEPNRITQVDIATANALMNANAGATREAMTRLLAAQTAVTPLLKEIPVGADISDPGARAAAVRVLEVLQEKSVKGTLLAVASKLLSIKRPGLIPMLDSVVQDCVDHSDASGAMDRFAELALDPATHRTLERLAGRVKGTFGIPVTPVRVLDQLIWFDWNLAREPRDGVWVSRAFPDTWGYRHGKNAVVGPLRRKKV